MDFLVEMLTLITAGYKERIRRKPQRWCYTLRRSHPRGRYPHPSDPDHPDSREKFRQWSKSKRCCSTRQWTTYGDCSKRWSCLVAAWSFECIPNEWSTGMSIICNFFRVSLTNNSLICLSSTIPWMEIRMFWRTSTLIHSWMIPLVVLMTTTTLILI